MKKKILFIYPHPDDESFGPAGVMNYYQRNGTEVHLLTLTHGEATKIRYDLGISKEEMAKIRKAEMDDVANELNLASMTVLALPDNELKELDPRLIEYPIARHIHAIDPQVIVSYPVHGISGFHDHLITHGVVKRVFCELREDSRLSLARLAMFTFPEDLPKVESIFKIHTSKTAEIDCQITVEDVDFDAHMRALDCYKSYSGVIERSGVRKAIGRNSSFELFDEFFSPPIQDFFDKLPT